MTKQDVWDYFMLPKFKTYRPRYCTDFRLKKNHNKIFDDKFLWQDVMERHGMTTYPTVQEWHWHTDKPTFDHCIGNFWGMICAILQGYKE